MPSTALLALPYPASTDADDVPLYLQNLATSVEVIFADQGTRAARPATPLRGRRYWATDEKQEYRADGTTWDTPGVSKAGGSTILASAAGVIPLVIKLASGQTASGLEMRSNADVVLAKVDAAGAITSGVHTITSPTAGAVPLTLKLAAGQTADAAKVLASDGTTVLARVGASGQIYAPDGSALLSTTAGDLAYGPKPRKGLASLRPGTAPPATTPSAGIAGLRYYATDTDREYLDDGTTWHEILTTTAGSAAYRPATFRGASVLASGAAQSVPDSTYTAIAFASETADTSGFHDNVTNNTRLTVPAGMGGWYAVTAQVAWTAHGTGARVLSIRKNGTTYTSDSGAQAPTAGEAAKTVVVQRVQLAAGDYVEIMGKQTSGAALTISASNINHAEIEYLGT